MKIAITISDERMRQIFHQLSKHHSTIALYEHSAYEQLKNIDAVILPVKGLDDNGHLHVKDRVWEIPKEFWSNLRPDCLIFAGLPHPFLDQLSCQRFYYMQQEELRRKNAVLTAEGVLFLFIDNTVRSIQEQKVDVIGYGRCGKEIVTWLKALHVPVRIVRRECEEDEASITVEHYKKAQPGDVIINTSIQHILKQEVMENWNSKPLILDIASGEVMDSKAAQRLGIRVIKAGNLPCIVAYESAGNLISEYIEEVLIHEG